MNSGMTHGPCSSLPPTVATLGLDPLASPLASWGSLGAALL